MKYIIPNSVVESIELFRDAFYMSDVGIAELLLDYVHNGISGKPFHDILRYYGYIESVQDMTRDNLFYRALETAMLKIRLFLEQYGLPTIDWKHIRDITVTNNTIILEIEC